MVSEVKFIQVPGVLTAGSAPHPAVIALQLTLSLALFIGLFGSLYQDIEENLLKVSCVLIGQPACVLFLTFSPRSHNLDLNLAWQEQYG